MLLIFCRSAIKNKSFLVFLFVLFAAGLKGQPTADISATHDFLITGNITGLPDSTMVLLSEPDGTSNVIATGISRGGKFQLFGKTAQGHFSILSFIGRNEQVEVFLTGDRLAVTGNNKSLGQAVVSGSSAQLDYNTYKSGFEKYRARLTQLVKLINGTPEGVKRDSLIQKFEQTKSLVLKDVDQFIALRPASPVTPFVLFVTNGVNNNNVEDLEKRFGRMAPAAQASYYGEVVRQTIAAGKIGMVGTQAIDFTQNDTANNPVSLSSFKGKYVLVDFWASWCGPCRHENPAVVRAYNTFKEKNFTVLGVSLDQDRKKWLQAIQVDNLAWTHVSDLMYFQNAVAQLYRINSIPANMLVDPSGKIIARNLRGQDLLNTLEAVLK